MFARSRTDASQQPRFSAFRRLFDCEAEHAVPPAVGGQPAAAPAVMAGNSPAVQKILANYNVSSITPTEFSQMIQKLFDAGAISQKDLQDLNGVRSDLEIAGVGADENVNLPQFYSQKIRAAQNQATGEDAAASQEQIAPLLRRLDWMEKFQAMKAQPAGASLARLPEEELPLAADVFVGAAGDVVAVVFDGDARQFLAAGRRILPRNARPAKLPRLEADRTGDRLTGR